MDAAQYDRLPDATKAFVAEIEAAGYTIVVRRVDQSEFLRWLPGATEIQVGVWWEGGTAVIAHLQPEIPLASLVHELLHLWLTVKGFPSVTTGRNKPNQGLQNDLQHLYIVPLEAAQVGFRRDFWAHQYLLKGLADLYELPSFTWKQRALVRYLVAVSLFDTDVAPSPLWEQLGEHGWQDDAQRFAEEGMRLLGDVAELFRHVARAGIVPQQNYVFGPYNPLTDMFRMQPLF